MTITTYYPSPYGSYKELSSYRMKIGSTYSTTSMTDADNGKLIVEGPVGIGTTAPAVKLHVLGGLTLYNPAGSNYNEGIRMPAANSGYASFMMGADPNATIGSINGQWTLVRWPAANSYMFTIRHQDSDLFTILQGGNVGIGTTGPALPLSIVANAAGTGTTYNEIGDVSIFRCDVSVG